MAEKRFKETIKVTADQLHFDDIRPEEWTPSYAGSSARMDFLLKKEQIVLEIKKTRKGLVAKEAGEQLIVELYSK